MATARQHSGAGLIPRCQDTVSVRFLPKRWRGTCADSGVIWASRNDSHAATPGRGAAPICRNTLRRDALMTRRYVTCSVILLLSLITLRPFPSLAQDIHKDAGMRFNVSFPAAKSAHPLDGRVLVLLSTNNTEEPR